MRAPGSLPCVRAGIGRRDRLRRAAAEHRPRGGQRRATRYRKNKGMREQHRSMWLRARLWHGAGFAALCGSAYPGIMLTASE